MASKQAQLEYSHQRKEKRVLFLYFPKHVGPLPSYSPTTLSDQLAQCAPPLFFRKVYIPGTNSTG